MSVFVNETAKDLACPGLQAVSWKCSLVVCLQNDQTHIFHSVSSCHAELVIYISKEIFFPMTCGSDFFGEKTTENWNLLLPGVVKILCRFGLVLCLNHEVIY